MDNPLLNKWTGSYGGVPPFDRVKVEHFKPAIETAITEHLGEIEKIAGKPDPPTFDNTIAALERSGRTLDRAACVYGVYSGTKRSEEFQQVMQEIEPRMAAYRDEIVQNEHLFRRIKAVYEGPEQSKLTPEQQRLTWHHYTTFLHNGAGLDAAAKKRMSEINQRLATLFTEFSQNVLADENNYMLILDREEDLAGLPETLRSAAAAAAEERGHKGKWAILNLRSSIEPFLTYSDRRDLREKAWHMFHNRGDNGDASDNKKIIAEIVRLRAERAALLGYSTHAHWRLEKSMAKTPQRAIELLEAFWKPAAARVAEEVADMQAVADREGAAISIEPWDYRYYAEKVRKAKYDVDENEIRPYLQLEKMQEAMFWVAGELLDLSFVPAEAVPTVHNDIQVWEVRTKGGKHVGLFYFDLYARKDKQSGAWMDAYRNQERFAGEIAPIVSNNSSFVKGTPGTPILLSWDDARTLFHEFGHALHGLTSSVHYPSLSGTNVDRDYVEFPSQLLEHWLNTPAVLNKYARHYRTGEPIPSRLVEKIERASHFNKGFETAEYLTSAISDMRLHLAPEKAESPAAFEQELLTALHTPRQIVMRHRLPHFGHLFSGDAYSAGYYSYLWAEVLSADAFEAFTEAAGPYDKTVARKLREHVFSAGNTVDPATAYRSFRGREPAIGALLRKRGFPE